MEHDGNSHISQNSKIWKNIEEWALFSYGGDKNVRGGGGGLTSPAKNHWNWIMLNLKLVSAIF